ncbi:hypothetical protein E6W36_14130 [Hankyongella ginsenosidimutans]|uniref:Helix-turn-helix domain-containing protein n=1 Tax=Hankyongella ginsenosidimutans TaxID=1763828 RepID=A0A4D7CAB0_9SPHN|nr:hypothetical protein E6W36_14130 [Hankyongella ginsenosidimutans]
MAPPEPGERSVAQKVLALMGQGAAAQEEVAQLLGCSVATLRRRLTEENTSYRDLRAEHLNMAARRMLAEGMSLADTADALGFRMHAASRGPSMPGTRSHRTSIARRSAPFHQIFERNCPD